MYRIGVDVGGTFTDFTLLNESTGEVLFYKVSSTPSDPSEAILVGAREMLKEFQVKAADVSFIGHGTTVATNLIIERKGAKTALITTKGFRDVLEIGRQTRPHLYDYQVHNPPVLVPRALRFEVSERLDSGGKELSAVDMAEVDAIIEKLIEADVKAVAICFLHSYINPAHEAVVRDRLRERLPDLYVTASADLLPEFREFERLSTTVLNSYSGPRMQTYLDRLANNVSSLGSTVTPYTIHSNGGLMSIPTVRQFPVRTCLSGPAAGVVGAAVVAKEAGFENVLTFDVGGTSTDVSVIVDGQPQFTSNRTVADYPVKTPMVDIHVIGAGGGSIASIDDAGALKVGPHSAGAVPGPVAYGRGGDKPTVTDANVVLHRLSPVTLLNGKLKVEEDDARRVLQHRVAAPLDLALEDAAVGILRITNANMGRAIRSVSTERGHDLSKFALMAFGGAGPLHACDVAAECGIPTVIIPREPGTMCARGILLSDISLDFVRTLIKTATPSAWDAVTQNFAEMRAEGAAWLEGEKVEADLRRYVQVVEVRYEGQNFEVAVAVPSDTEMSLADFLAEFAKGHHAEYGYDIPGRAVEIVNCRIKAVGLVPKPHNDFHPDNLGTIDGARIGSRTVLFSAKSGRIETPIYERSRMPLETAFSGPAIIEEMSSTTVIPPEAKFHVDRAGNIIISNMKAV
ncbi:hydantoinase/oxoprolinase family protein [Rhizobium leguminosarum]|uniref:hydantoinase/oxoprolinase family protein n=1 Tax=Rhizobium leguminosarum TaxID=384 RepID=UPI0014413878|nr:hydantoinase/oxoprolinase family protein [Rhizobium leguminosarum]MBY5836295.1 hydantoinase/oxoprolinase family protein [Rhizobium leguminosarum]NKM79013.1 hydantoinase/oxoprolinase family protein [Rhizobium leguminosarum bv. viciae]QSZ08613.1 hydantoinase/oxoprolinase family protein [Rhizobium leguminosarum]